MNSLENVIFCKKIENFKQGRKSVDKIFFFEKDGEFAINCLIHL